MLHRVLAGLLVGAVWLAALRFMPGWMLFLVMAAMSGICQAEFYKMLSAGRTRFSCSSAWGISLGTLWLAWCYAVSPPVAAAAGGFLPQASVPVLVSLVGVFLARVLFMKQDRPVEYAAVTLLGFFYLPVMFTFLIRIAQWGANGYAQIAPDRTGIYLALFVAAVVKFNDVGGFAFGIPFGKHKLIPQVSPKKSWEGMFGGFLFAILVSLLLTWLAHTYAWVPGGPLKTLPYPAAAVLGVVLALVGLFGDLVESRIKRDADTKDSSVLLPGLGGILDMFDSLVFAPAVFYLFLQLAKF